MLKEVNVNWVFKQKNLLITYIFIQKLSSIYTIKSNTQVCWIWSWQWVRCTGNVLSCFIKQAWERGSRRSVVEHFPSSYKLGPGFNPSPGLMVNDLMCALIWTYDNAIGWFFPFRNKKNQLVSVSLLKKMIINNKNEKWSARFIQQRMHIICRA